MNNRKAKFLRKLAQAHNADANPATEYWSRKTKDPIGAKSTTFRVEVFPSCTRAKYQKLKKG